MPFSRPYSDIRITQDANVENIRGEGIQCVHVSLSQEHPLQVQIRLQR
jgi:hypothetical protein